MPDPQAVHFCCSTAISNIRLAILRCRLKELREKCQPRNGFTIVLVFLFVSVVVLVVGVTLRGRGRGRGAGAGAGAGGGGEGGKGGCSGAAAV